ncbi:response regulator transcription factor [Cellulophaga sp. L1A9]|uniref:response regulator transcription factor n=1 Tax=Cellulophaga sp. L1A9 TaxID=2686362 RepID=UPI00131C31CC|nr:response regulator [Cellulophaga sp. L1A9]
MVTEVDIIYKVESEYLKGSKFVVRLPLDIEAEPEIVENIKTEFLINSMNSVDYDMSVSNTDVSNEPVKQEENGAKLPTLLLVEDNKELRVHLKNDLIRNYDVMMPKMDEFEMCKALKSELETCHIPIILLTARTLEDDRIEGYDSGADGYIAKPFVTAVLKARIKNLLETKKRL